MPTSRRSQSLSRDVIVDEALRIIRTKGFSALTMRAVATGLGVTPMAAYYYVADKDELLRLVSERVSTSAEPLRLKPDEEWEDVLKAHLLSLWEHSTRYPGLGAYLINQPDLGVTLDQLDSDVRFFEDAGFPAVEARLAWSFALTYIHGRISVDAHFAHRAEAPRLEGLRAPDYVEYGVDTLIAGLQAMLESGTEPVARPRALRGQ